MLRVDVQTREGDSLFTEPKSTILITGTSGRIGYPLARRLGESFNVVAFDLRAPSHPPQRRVPVRRSDNRRKRTAQVAGYPSTAWEPSGICDSLGRLL